MEREVLQKLVETVREAQDGHIEIEKITKALAPTLTIEQAYEVQRELVRQKVARGEKICGPKMGLTSLAKLKQMNVTDPIYGYIFDTMLVQDGGVIQMKNYIHPKAEPEIGFVMARDMAGPGITKEDILQATACIFPAIEIIDSRYQNFDFTLPDVIADNTSAAGSAFGPSIPLSAGIDLARIGVRLLINGQVAVEGTGAAVMGHPALSVACLANMLAAKGECIKAGQPILTGGITAAVALAPGDVVQAKFDAPLGSAGFRVE